MKEVMIRIKGKQVSKDSGEDEMEFMTEGKLYRRKGGSPSRRTERWKLRSDRKGKKGCGAHFFFIGQIISRLWPDPKQAGQVCLRRHQI